MNIFEVEDGKLKLNVNVLAIPELKAVYEANKEDYEPPLLYIHYMTHPDSAYHELEETTKQSMISDDVGGDFDLEDELIEAAIEKCRTLYQTAVQDYYEGLKNGMHVMGRYLKSMSEASITTGRDGNLGEIIRLLKESGTTMKNFLAAEKTWKEQVQQRLRGNSELGEY